MFERTIVLTLLLIQTLPAHAQEPEAAQAEAEDKSSGESPEQPEWARRMVPPSAEAKQLRSTESDAGEVLTSPRVEWKAGPWLFAPIALVEVQASPYVGEASLFQTGDIAERPGFRLRRARLGLGVEFEEKTSAALSFELTGAEASEVGVHDASLRHEWAREVALRAGAQAVPFSRSAVLGSEGSALIELPLSVRSLAPFHQVGAEVEGQLFNSALEYHVGAFNGFQREDLFYSGYVENEAVHGNRYDGLAYVVRVATEPMGPLGPTLEDVTSTSPFRIGVGANYFFSDGGTRNVHAASFDGLVHASGFHLLLEVLWERSQPEALPTQPTSQSVTINSYAAIVEAGMMVVKERLGITSRFEWINPNTTVDDELDDWLLTGGVSYRVVRDILKAQAEFTRREERFGLSRTNDSFTLQAQFSL